MTVKKAVQSQEIRPSTGSIKSQYVFILLGLIVIAILAVTWLAFSSINSLGKSALDIDKMAAVEASVMDEIREAVNQNLRSFIFTRVVPFSVLILGVAFTIGMIWMNRITNPLKQVIENTRTIKSEGSAVFPNEAPGEIGLLARELTDMVEHLHLRQVKLENHANEQAQATEKKTTQLMASAHMARETTITSQLEHFMARSVNLIGDRFGYYHVAIFVLDLSGQLAVLRAASGEAGQKMLAMRHRLKVNQSSIVGYAASTGMVRTVPDVNVDTTYFRNPLLNETRSEIALPLRINQRTIGVLDIQSKMTGDFREDDLLILQTLANQISSAIDKAHWIQQYQETLAKLELVREDERLGGKRSQTPARKIDGYVFDLTGVKPIEAGEEPFTEEQPTGKLFRMPLEVRGEVVAELDLWSEGEALSIQEKNLLDEIRSHVSQAIESSQLFEETQVRVKRERILNQFAANLSKSFDLDALLQQAVRELAQMPNVNEVAILIKPPTTQEPVTQVSRKTAPVGSDGKESSMEGLS